RRTLPVERGRHDAASVPGALTARKEPECLRVHARCRIARDADRRRRARLDADHHGLVGEVAAHPLSEGTKACTQAPGDRGRQQLGKTHRMNPGPGGRCRQVRAGPGPGELDEPLRARHEPPHSPGERRGVEGPRARPRRWRSANTSRAECPVARITPPPATTPFAAVTTPVTTPPANARSVTRVAHRTSPPQSAMVARSACTTCGRRFVPTWGCESIRISGGAPWRTSTSSTARTEPRFVARV